MLAQISDFALKWVTGVHTMHYTFSHSLVINLPYPSCYYLLEPPVLFMAGGKWRDVPANTREGDKLVSHDKHIPSS